MKTLLLRLLLSVVGRELIEAVLAKVIDYLRSRAKATQNDLDDRLLDLFERAVDRDDLVAMIHDAISRGAAKLAAPCLAMVLLFAPAGLATAAPIAGDPPMVIDESIKGRLAGVKVEDGAARVLVVVADGSSHWYDVAPDATLSIDGKEADRADALRLYRELRGKRRQPALTVMLRLEAGRAARIEVVTKP